MLNTDLKRIFSIALPAALNQFFDMFQVLVDMIFIGRISAVAIASVGLSMNLIGTLYAVISIFSIGTNVLVARFFGAKDEKSLSIIVGTSLITSFIVSLPITLAIFFLSKEFFLVFGDNTLIAETGSVYMKIVSLSIPFLFIGAVLVSTSNGLGDTKTPLYIGIIGNILNTILDYILIFGEFGFPELQVKGAAIATTTAYVVEVIIYLFLVFHKKIFQFKLKFDFQKALKLLKIGIPAGMERLIIQASFMVFIWIISLYGTYVLAGYQVGLRIEGLAFMPGFGFSIAAMTLVGQFLGAKRPDLAHKFAIKTAVIAGIIMQIIGLFLFLFPEDIASLFTNDLRTIKEASIYLKIVALSQFPLAIDFVLSGALRGAGATKTSLLVNTASLWFFRILPALIMTFFTQNIIYVYLIMLLETYIKGYIIWYIFQKGKWKEVRV